MKIAAFECNATIVQMVLVEANTEVIRENPLGFRVTLVGRCRAIGRHAR